MNDLIRQLLSKEPTREAKINRLREFLQVLMLRELYDLGYFKNLSFVGGTALRLVFDLRRFSEDLDFSLYTRTGYGFTRLASGLQRRMYYYGFETDFQTNDQKTVQNIDVRFKDVLFKHELSPLKTQKLYIRLEIDTKPPPGWHTRISVINRTFIFTVTHFDLESLYALKLHACFYRKYTKGRDFYDLIWYLSKKITPNFTLLNNAVNQTEGKDPHITADNFHDFLDQNLTQIDFAKTRKDVERFLEDKSELKLFDRKLILGMLDQQV